MRISNEKIFSWITKKSWFISSNPELAKNEKRNCKQKEGRIYVNNQKIINIDEQNRILCKLKEFIPVNFYLGKICSFQSFSLFPLYRIYNQ